VSINAGPSAKSVLDNANTLETLSSEQSQPEHRVRRTLLLLLGRVLIFVAFLAIWQLLSGRVINPLFISSPWDVAMRLKDWIADGSLFTNIWVTLKETLLGFLIGSVVGVLFGILLGRTPTVASLLRPFITGLYCMPLVALGPLFILWFGIGLTSKVSLAAVIVFFLVFTNTFAGASAVDRELLSVASLMGAGRFARFVKVIFPATLEWIFIGLRLAIPYALVGAVVGEILASNTGIGFLIQSSSGTFNTAGTFAGLAVLVVLGLIMSALLGLISRAGERWRHLD
jgi:NitT/TauT family transport system permease protein